MKHKIDRNEIVAAVRRVPLISTSASRLLQIANHNGHSLADIVTIVKCDAALTIHILKVVNSAALSRGREIHSLDRAIAIMGEEMVMGIAMSDAAEQLFQADLDGYAANRGDLWRHDLRTAIAAKRIAPFAKVKVNHDLAFTSGLLHDLGKAIISDFLKGTTEEIVTAIEAGQFEDYPAAEREELGVDHCDIGFELATYWGLPEPLLSVIRHHHHPLAAAEPYRPLVYVVHLGDIVAMMTGSGTGADAMRCNIDPAYGDYVNLAKDDLARIIFEAETEFTALISSLSGEGEQKP
ncbi:MAG: HDOD domain-containing protein [Desulfobulbaceae bacterium]|nr:HDOD domain-containing protein [Desulfobulbaceae bacterium]